MVCIYCDSRWCYGVRALRWCFGEIKKKRRYENYWVTLSAAQMRHECKQLILFWKQARICTLYSFVTCNCPKLCPNLSVHKCANIAALDRCIQLFYCNTLVCGHFTFMSPSVHYNRWVLHSTMLALVWKAIDLCCVKSAAHITEECNGVSVLN